jgi:hypothetical protein
VSSKIIPPVGTGRLAAAAIAAALGLGALGCEATFQPPELTVAYGAAAVPVRVPNNIAAYPHVFYDNTWFYLVDGQWYAPSPQGWVMLRQEPQELGRYRRYYQEPQYEGEPPPLPSPAPAYPSEQGRYRRYER